MTIIEGFYKDFDKVTAEIEKLPITYTAYNCDTMVDARKSYACNMKGTDFPYLDNLGSTVARLVSYSGDDVWINRNLLVNCNQTLSEDYKTKYWNPHRDPESIDLAILVFLNKEYGRGDGFITYKNPENVEFYNHPLWFEKDELEMNNFVQGRPNRAVLFDPQILHGSHTTTDMFSNQFRYTQIIFCNLK